MSIALNDRRNDYTGNDVTIQFAYDYRILAEDYLKVVVTDLAGDETVLTLDTDYTVAGVGSLSGGYIELVDASQAWLHPTSNGLKTGYSITINGQTPVTQTTDIRNQGPYYPSLHEDAFDKLTMIAQELLATVRRAPLFRYATGVVDRVFPDPDPGKAIIWGPTGQLVNTEVDINAIDQAVSDSAASAAAALASENAAAASESAAAVSAANAATFIGSSITLQDYGSVLNANLTIPSGATYSFIRVNSPAASRTITLPAANAYPAGRQFTVWDQGANAGSFAIVVQRAGADTIEGSTSVSLAQANIMRTFITDGVSRWSVSGLKQQEVTGTNIADSAVGATKLASDAVTTVKILDSNVTTNKLAANAVTRAKLAAVGQQISSSSGSIAGQGSTTNSTATDVFNLTATLTTTGRPVVLAVVPDGTTNPMVMGILATSAGASVTWSGNATYTLLEGSTTIAVFNIGIGGVTTATQTIANRTSQSFFHIYTPAAGTYTWKFQFQQTGTAGTITAFCQNAKLVAFEL